jgi:hypothetical protein
LRPAAYNHSPASFFSFCKSYKHNVTNGSHIHGWCSIAIISFCHLTSTHSTFWLEIILLVTYLLPHPFAQSSPENMLRLRASELTLTSEDVEETFRRMVERKAQDANRRVPSQHPQQHPQQTGQPILRQGPQRFVRDAITTLGDIPILRPQPHLAVIAHVDDDSDDDANHDTAIPQRVDSVRSPMTQTPNSQAPPTAPSTVTASASPAPSPSPASRTLHMPFRLRRSRRAPFSQLASSNHEAEGSGAIPTQSPQRQTDGANDPTDMEETDQASPGLRGGAGKGKEREHTGRRRRQSVAEDDSPEEGNYQWIVDNMNPTGSTLFLSGYFPPEENFDPSSYTFEAIRVEPHTEPRPRPRRPALPTRSHSAGHASAQRTPQLTFSGPALAALSESAFQRPSAGSSRRLPTDGCPSSGTNRGRSRSSSTVASEYGQSNNTVDYQAILDAVTGRISPENTHPDDAVDHQAILDAAPNTASINLPPANQAYHDSMAGEYNLQDPTAPHTPTYPSTSDNQPFPRHPSEPVHGTYDYQSSTRPFSNPRGLHSPLASGPDAGRSDHDAGHGGSPQNRPAHNSSPFYQSRNPGPSSQAARAFGQPSPGFEHDIAQPGSSSGTGPRRFSSEASANSGAYSWYEYPRGSRQSSNQQPQRSSVLPQNDGTSTSMAAAQASYHSSPFQCSQHSNTFVQQFSATSGLGGQHGVSPMPSRPYTRPSSASPGEPSASGQTMDAVTAALRNVSSPLEPYSHHYVQHHIHQYTQPGPPARVRVDQRPLTAPTFASTQHSAVRLPPHHQQTVNQGGQRAQHGPATHRAHQHPAAQPGGLPMPNPAQTPSYQNPTLSSGRRTSQQNPRNQQNISSDPRAQGTRSRTTHRGPGSSPNDPSPNMRGGDTRQVAESTARSTRVDQRSSENAPVRPSAQSFGPSSNTQVQRHRAAFERLHNAELEAVAPQATRASRHESARPGSFAPRDTSNQPRMQIASRNSLNDRMRRRVQNLASPRLPPGFRAPDIEPPADDPSSLHGGGAIDRSYTRRRRPTPVPPPVNVRERPSTAIALEQPVAVRSPLARALTLARPHRRLPPQQQEQENVGVEESVMREEFDAVLARYGVEQQRGETMDETPPRVGRVERRMGEQ